MKKIGFLALALGLFVAACNNAGTENKGDSASLDSAINAVPPVDSSAAQTIDSAAQVIDSAAQKIDSAVKH
ncbi:hypothetical protein [Chitinophaga niabensis]|uniref:Lipoprotein n=1 Tax=Chitinophaga niabensis TaxID=536979 RepID=A0A1N6GFH1_9BACT|nr:hypothetical protein [Chitinophaga niabensis]SIO06227.1 hypothetical protein SAMN04488055_2742 [Chitinophaga niabensis]